MQIEKMKRTRKLCLTTWQLFGHYSIVLLFSVFPVYTIIALVKDYLLHDYAAAGRMRETIIAGCVGAVPVIILCVRQKRRLRLRVINTNVTVGDLMNAAEEAAKELGWKIEKVRKDLIVARSRFGFPNRGELMTIIKDGDRILFNSICDPDRNVSVASFGMNKLNRTTFEHKLLETAKG
jgi:hypothetical protein